MRRGAAAVAAAALVATTATAQPRLESHWPHPSGASWTYDRVQLAWGGGGTQAAAATVRFGLGDSTAVGAGVGVQPLGVSVAGASLFEGAALAWQLARARPAAIRRAGASTAGASSGLVIHDATLLRVADDEVAGYRADLGIRSWLYLEPDVTPGHTFRLQLVPDLADSVFLDGTVVGAADISTPAGSFAAALRVRYRVDYGWTDVRDDSGQLVGRTHGWTSGEMFWAPGVGPVLARETFAPQAETTGNPPPPAADSTFAELRLAAWWLLPTAVTTAPWAAVKRRYR